MDNGNGKQARFKLSTDTIALIEGLSQAEYGQVATYAALSDLIGRDVQKEAAHVLHSALNILERDYSIFFSCVRGEGVMRITESEHLISVPAQVRDGIHNKATKGIRRIGYLPDNKLTREELTEKLRVKASLGALAEYATEKEAKEPPKKPQAPANADKTKTLELFKKKG